MIDFTIAQTKQRLIRAFRLKYPISLPLKIVIVTYNRLPYLMKCIASIQASTTLPYQITVMDDGSTDGTVKWLSEQRKRGKIDYLVFNKRVGTAENFNQGIQFANCEWVVMANDDCYFHRWWDFAALQVINAEPEAATVTLYDFTNNSGILERKKDYDQVTGTGLATAFIRSLALYQAGEFKLPPKQKMGSFAAKTCAKMKRFSDSKLHFITRPCWTHHMDFPTSKLSERDVLRKYVEYRRKEKKIK